MREAVIVSAVRTAVGKAPKGTLKNTRPEDLGAAVIKEAVRRAPGLEPGMIDDVVIGCAMPEGEQGLNIARIISVYAGLPTTVPAFTINRFCSSGLQSIAIAAEKIMCGFADVVIAGGVESMSHVPMTGYKLAPHPEIVEKYPEIYISMGHTAENVAERFGISREEQDRFAVASHAKAAAAIREGKFKDEIIPLTVREKQLDAKGKLQLREFIFDTDEGVRPDTNMEALARLRSPFRIGGSVTAGNASQTSDGAAAVIVMSREKAEELELKPMAVFRSFAVGGVDPEIMGVGPITAIPKALKLAGITQDQVDLFEINEAFASQAIQVIRHLNIDESKVNVNGGAIALGHPLGCSGTKLTVTMLYEAARRNAKYGVVSMCIGGGMGAAGVFEFVKQ
ncbi:MULTISPECIES: acetyl-CoA C-acetyltransferase [Aneurinibacillus]|uniref:acetyl-CoA C-acyltransferase n=1 Tax=Aneurinibacillus thermoaerophilus TaxID=143495 RepID=A0A1G7XCC9_ANETH|nr:MULTISPECIES: acetyl-CoA C-acetyltransferase [Aneurinibacillus]AMA73311.1 acetyl-CoA acetyltransferase [Aneurinibacillus sp. XH2]MED0678261.1 acetyl-CoA C-acetyltransferase [Aneurinibacillus thermoaerophilus]MED0736213.1 acetyl-CoA C-acetyltransferase [Aneurinibacillus thermoaerophilus]MED0758839.1 acetyl-CoA C-acetyltransferase [Aneurinibacillus thermoaerophilus]MED0760484.1 acetyl-CoA C-acetyltransferase [Aneurinibacillus thermoaerophilus]